jgi:hypothetical protein
MFVESSFDGLVELLFVDGFKDPPGGFGELGPIERSLV